MDIVYMFWAKKQAIKYMSEFAVSVLSLKKHMPNATVSVYADLSNEKVAPIIPFLDHFVDNIYEMETDTKGSTFSKFLMFPKILDRFSSFLFLDCDTIICRPIPEKIWKIDDIRFAGYRKQPKLNYLNPMKDRTFQFFKENFGIKKPLLRSCSCVIGVDQRCNKKFWIRFKKEIYSLIEQFMEKIDKSLANSSKNYGGIYNDEFYFTLALRRLGISMRKKLYSIDTFSDYSTKYLSHHPYISKKDQNKYRKEIKNVGIHSRFLKYPRRK